MCLRSAENKNSRSPRHVLTMTSTVASRLPACVTIAQCTPKPLTQSRMHQAQVKVHECHPHPEAPRAKSTRARSHDVPTPQQVDSALAAASQRNEHYPSPMCAHGLCHCPLGPHAQHTGTVDSALARCSLCHRQQHRQAPAQLSAQHPLHSTRIAGLHQGACVKGFSCRRCEGRSAPCGPRASSTAVGGWVRALQPAVVLQLQFV
jgi:hypothetical protein